ncbi:MAG: dephospho-CoA kinase [Sporolactobacillus sp.]
MLKIGLTGGIASGKSTVADWLKAQNFPLIDADEIAKQVVEPGEEGLERIAAHFGRAVLQADGSLDRKQLGDLIFADQEQREQLNQLLHPLIRRKMLRAVSDYEKEGAEVVFLDIPLLFDSGLEDWVDRTIVVFVPAEVQLQRLIKRNHLTEQQARARIASQMPLAEKRRRATAVIDNRGTILQTRQQIQKLLERWNLLG